MKIAERYASREMLPITKDELKILEIFTEYKLSGFLHQLFNSLSFSDIRDLLNFQREFLTNLTLKILYFELSIFVDEKQLKLTYNAQNAKFTKLLEEYFKRSKVQLFSKIFGFTLFAFWSFARHKRRKELFATFVFHKKPPKILLNVIMTLLLIYDNELLARKFLEALFPWVAADETNEPLQKMLILWQSAEQSIKL
jgi:hypothetical protein